MMEDFKDEPQDKILLKKLLLRVQQAYEEREMHLRHDLSSKDIERLVSRRSPFGDAASVGAKFFQAILEHRSRTLSLQND